MRTRHKIPFVRTVRTVRLAASALALSHWRWYRAHMQGSAQVWNNTTQCYGKRYTLGVCLADCTQFSAKALRFFTEAGSSKKCSKCIKMQSAKTHEKACPALLQPESEPHCRMCWEIGWQALHTVSPCASRFLEDPSLRCSGALKSCSLRPSLIWGMRFCHLCVWVVNGVNGETSN